MIYKYLGLGFIFLVIICFSNCKESEKQKKEEELINIDIDTSSIFFRYKNTIFSPPSPQQTNIFIKEYNIRYNGNLLNPVNNYSKYTSNIRKCLNIGVYGTDLGYMNTYHQTQNILHYFLVIEKLAEDLKISTAVPQKSMENIENNLSNNDSILIIIASTYQSIDRYLRTNNREVIGSLILAGSWIETMYIITQTIAQNVDKRMDLIKLIVEQKYPLDKLIKQLSPYYEQNETFTNFIDQLTDLAYEFDCIDVYYKYNEPETYPEEKLTVINNEATYELNDYNFSIITDKVKKIKNYVTN